MRIFNSCQPHRPACGERAVFEISLQPSEDCNARLFVIEKGTFQAWAANVMMHHRRGGYCVPFELPSDAIGSLSHRVHRRQRRHVYSGFGSEESRQFFVCVFTWFKVGGADEITESSPSSQRSTTLTT
eukprot:scaffold25219_cov104-Skeletonema_dohrnii-CCMP3373.AAC.1